MKHNLVIIIFLLLVGPLLLAQGTLDINTYSDCELFPEKENFDKQERLNEIKTLGGQQVTVYQIKGKNNKIKNKYTGKIDLTLVNKGELPIENLVHVLVVTESKKNNQQIAHFPLTNKSVYRIYLTECLNK